MPDPLLATGTTENEKANVQFDVLIDDKQRNEVVMRDGDVVGV